MNLEMDIAKMGLQLKANLEDEWYVTVEIYRDTDDMKHMPYLYDASIGRWDRDTLVFTNLQTHTWPRPETLFDNIEHYLRAPQIIERWPGKHSVVSADPIAWFFDVEIVPNSQEDFKTVGRVYTRSVTELELKFNGFSQTTYVTAKDISSLLECVKEEIKRRCSSWVEEAIRNAGFETNENDPYVLSHLSDKSIRRNQG